MRKLALSLALLSLVIAISLFWMLRGDDEHRANVIESSGVESPELPSSGELAAPQTDASVDAVDQRVAQSDAPPTEVVEAPLDPRLARLIVTVVSRESWEPVIAAPVFVDRNAAIAHQLSEAGSVGSIGEGVITDALGIARFDLPPTEKLRVFPRHPGFAPESGVPFEQLSSTAFSVQPLEAGEVREIEIHISTITGDLHLLVVDEADEQPIEGAEVRHGRQVLSRSDAAGRAVYDLGFDAYFSIKVRAAGYGPAIVPLSDRREGAEAPFIVRLRRGAGVRGRVLGLDEPAAFRVQFLTESSQLTQPSGSTGFGMHAPNDAQTAPLDVNGAFEIEGLPTKVQVQALISDAQGKWVPLQREPLYFEPGELRSIEWDQAGFGSIRGRVVDSEGQPLSGESIALQAGARGMLFGIEGTSYLRRGTTDASGAFAFEDLQPGDYIVGVIARAEERAGEGTAKVVALVTIEAGHEIDDLELVVTDEIYLTGRVMKTGGEPVERVTVVAYANELGMMHGKTDVDGGFRLGPLSPGEYTVRVIVNRTLGEAAPPERIVQVPCDPLEIRLLEGGTLSGRAIDAQSGAAVAVLTSVHGASGKVQTSSGMGAGRPEFSYGGLLPGTYHITAIEVGGRVGILQDVALESGQTVEDLLIQMQPAETLDCVYRGEREDLALHVRVGEVILLAEPASHGSHHTQRIPLGFCEVELVLADSATTERKVIERRTVEVRPGNPLEVVFD